MAVTELGWCLAVVMLTEVRRTVAEWRWCLDWESLTGMTDTVLIPGFIGMMMSRNVEGHSVGEAEGACLTNGIVTLEGPAGVTCMCAVLASRGPLLISMGLAMRVLL